MGYTSKQNLLWILNINGSAHEPEMEAVLQEADVVAERDEPRNRKDPVRSDPLRM